MSNVGLGLIGLGRWGRQHIDGIQKTPGCHIVGAAARTPETASAIQAEFGIATTTEYHTLLSNPAVQGVIVTSPNYTHFPIAKEALEAGKHVLVEKPMAFTVAECDELIAAQQQSGKVLWVGHEFRQFAIWRKVHDLLHAGEIGQLRYGTLQLWRYPYRSGSGGWRADPSKVGNWLLEEPVHYFDLARWFMGTSPQTLYATASSRTPETAQFYENFSAVMTYTNGAYVEVSRTVASYNFEISIRFTGTEGVLKANWKADTDRSLNPTAQILLYRFAEQVEHNIPITQQTGHAFELGVQTEKFIQALQGKETDIVTGQDGRAAVYMCDAAARSIASSQVINLI